MGNFKFKIGDRVKVKKLENGTGTIDNKSSWTGKYYEKNLGYFVKFDELYGNCFYKANEIEKLNI